MRRVAFATLGCKLNQTDTESLRALLEADGAWTTVSEDGDPDLVVVNTCTVTSQADAKSRQTIRRLHERHPKAAIIAAGCYAQRAPQELAALPGVRRLVGAADRSRVAQIADAAFRGDIRADISPIEAAVDFLDVGSSSLSREKTRAFLRVQEGCGESCTFCIVPKTRGPSRSRPASSVLAETRALVGAGAREVVLTGVHLGEWGADFAGKPLLADLVRDIVEVPGLLRVRLSSIEPSSVTPELVDLLAADRRVARQVHLPLQSGSDVIREGMRRRLTARDFEDLVREFDRRVPGIAIGTDVIAGFPGETDLDFQRTFDLLESLPIASLHAFSYSPRPGSAAESLGDPVSGEVKRRRTTALRRLSEVKSLTFREAGVGTEALVLLERGGRDEPTLLSGLTDNALRVEVPRDANGRPSPGEVVRARLVEATGEGCRGELVEAM